MSASLYIYDIYNKYIYIQQRQAYINISLKLMCNSSVEVQEQAFYKT